MIQHQTEVLLLLDDFVSFLVEDVTQTVESTVEPPSSETPFVKAEVEFLVF
jgi:hypothetical protein